MFRRSLALAGALAAATALLPAVAHAARVTVRVEGRTQTIFAKAPRALEAGNALEALQAASLAGEFHVHVTPTSFGPYVDQVGRFAAGATSGWVFKVNGVSPPVGADQVALRDGDDVLWYWAEFGPSGGPPTLLLQRTGRRCFLAWLQDDNGMRTPARDVRVWITGIPKRTDADGSFCVAARVGLVHVTKDGAVRSNGLALRR